jgi:hypothetical protein
MFLAMLGKVLVNPHRPVVQITIRGANATKPPRRRQRIRSTASSSSSSAVARHIIRIANTTIDIPSQHTKNKVIENFTSAALFQPALDFVIPKFSFSRLKRFMVAAFGLDHQRP